MFDRIIVLLPAQLNWVLNYQPNWLGPVMMILGVVLFTVGFALNYSWNNGQFWLMAGLFAAAGITPWVFAYPTVFAGGLVLVGAWLQGVGLFRAVMKLNYYARRVITFTHDGTRKSSLPTEAGSLVRSLTRKAFWFIVFQAVTILGILLTGIIIAWLATTGPLTTTTVVFDLLVFWTITTAIGSTMGYLWRLWSIRDPLPYSILFGLVVMVVGAELYNIRLLQTDLLLFVLGKVVTLAALLATAALWVVRLRTRTKSWSSSSEVTL